MSAEPPQPDAAQPLLRTARLVLRPFEPADVPALVRLLGDPQIAANTLTIPHPYTEEDARAFLARVETGRREGTAVVFALCAAGSGELVGAAGLHLEPRHERAEVGFWLAAAWRGKGLASEAVRAVLRHAFDDLGLGRVFASHFPWNPASGHVLAAVGMRQEGTLRGHHLKDGRRIDGVVWGLLRDEHAALEAARRAGAGGTDAAQATLDP